MDIFSVIFDLMSLFFGVNWETMHARHQAKTDILQELDTTTK